METYDGIKSHLDAMYDAQAHRLLKSGESIQSFSTRKTEILVTAHMRALEDRLTELQSTSN
jgi:hypothetical protein